MSTLQKDIAQQRERLAELERREQQAREAAAIRAIRQAERLKAKDEAVADHQRAEQENAADLELAAKTLSDARKGLASTVDAAVTALQGVWDAAASYGQLLDETAEALIEAGLPARYDDDELCKRFTVGGYQRSAFGGPRVALAGRDWVVVPPRQALAFALELAMSGRVPGMQSPQFQPVNDVVGDLIRRPKAIPAAPQPRIEKPVL